MKAADVVISKRGKYDGGMFFVIAVENGFALIADGKRRKITNPKRKNLIHLEEIGFSSDAVREKLENGSNTVDALMRAELKRFKFMLQSKVSD